MEQSTNPFQPQHCQIYLIAIQDYTPNCDEELKLTKGEKLKLISKDENISGDEGWWVGQSGERCGIFPCNFVVTQVRVFLTQMFVSMDLFKLQIVFL